MFTQREFGTNRVTLSVQFWSFLPDEGHFKDQAFKLAPASWSWLRILQCV